jgi:hypothetical protein
VSLIESTLHRPDFATQSPLENIMTDIQKIRSRKKDPKAPILLCESEIEFQATRKRLEDEIKPRGIIEEIYVYDIAVLVWDIMRLRDCRVSTINTFFRKAIERVLGQLLPGYGLKKKALSDAYFDNEDARTEIYEILARYQLDDSVIMAEAINLAKDQLEHLDGMLATARTRLDRSLRSIQEYGVYFADRGRDSAEQILQSKDVPGIQPNRTEAV